MYPLKVSEEKRRRLWESVVMAYRDVDSLLARVFETLDERTVLIVVSDHGWDYDGAHHVRNPDGVFAMFDGPARAIRSAQAIRNEVGTLGLSIRAGIHTGEVEVGPDDVAGLGVHIGARVGALAQGDEVLVSRTVKDLVAGSGIEFEDRGVHELKGVPEAWQVFAVAG